MSMYDAKKLSTNVYRNVFLKTKRSNVLQLTYVNKWSEASNSFYFLCMHSVCDYLNTFSPQLIGLQNPSPVELILFGPQL